MPVRLHMARETLAMNAGNLIKALTQQAAIGNSRSIALMGFKGVLDIVVSYRGKLPGA